MKSVSGGPSLSELLLQLSFLVEDWLLNLALPDMGMTKASPLRTQQLHQP